HAIAYLYDARTHSVRSRCKVPATDAAMGLPSRPFAACLSLGTRLSGRFPAAARSRFGRVPGHHRVVQMCRPAAVETDDLHLDLARALLIFIEDSVELAGHARRNI